MEIYKELSKERKLLQSTGELPAWVTTNSWQMLKEKYLENGESLKDRMTAVANTAASHMPTDQELWADKFFNLLWSGKLSASTPVLANTGRGKCCPVSCSGGVIPDSVEGFYDSQKEAALLSKNGFGTSGYLGKIRPRGSKISGLRGSASGVLPVFRDFVQVSRDISQGSSRRGAWAGYIEIEHGDFYELVSYINRSPDDANIGWIISDEFINKLDNKDPESLERFQKAMKLKMVTGKGYFFFSDKVNRLSPEWYRNEKILASNLCTEIALPSTEDETFTCILSSLNLSKIKEFNSDDVFNSLIFLHCVALEFIRTAERLPGLEKAVRFTRRHMALGLGVLGFHTYLQDNMVALDSLQAHLINISIFTDIDTQTKRASRYLAGIFGEAEVCKGYGYANATRIAIAPTLSSSLICGGVSQGIEPIYKNAYIQGSAAGEMQRVNPSLLEIMKARKVYSTGMVSKIISKKGSVQWVDWLSEEEKRVFKTAFEWDQTVPLRLASARQPFIDQAQSINLFFSSDEDEKYIAKVHQYAFKDPNIKSLYYIRSESGVDTSKGECTACHA